MKQMINKGFCTLEYALFITALVFAFVAMSAYIRNAVCGKLRTSADTFGHGRQSQH